MDVDSIAAIAAATSTEAVISEEGAVSTAEAASTAAAATKNLKGRWIFLAGPFCFSLTIAIESVTVSSG
jgi:hypothetical protein